MYRFVKFFGSMGYFFIFLLLIVNDEPRISKNEKSIRDDYKF
jgi:hypothetical protein